MQTVFKPMQFLFTFKQYGMRNSFKNNMSYINCNKNATILEKLLKISMWNSNRT